MRRRMSAKRSLVVIGSTAGEWTVNEGNHPMVIPK
jgi:hypothetical protein